MGYQEKKFKTSFDNLRARTKSEPLDDKLKERADKIQNTNQVQVFLKKFYQKIASAVGEFDTFGFFTSQNMNLNGAYILKLIKLKDSQNNYTVFDAFFVTLVKIFEYTCELHDIDLSSPEFNPSQIDNSDFWQTLNYGLKKFEEVLLEEVSNLGDNYMTSIHKIYDLNNSSSLGNSIMINSNSRESGVEEQKIIESFSILSQYFVSGFFPEPIFRDIYNYSKKKNDLYEIEIGNVVKVYNYEQRLTSINRDGEEYEQYSNESDMPEIDFDKEEEVGKLVDSLQFDNLSLLENREHRTYYLINKDKSVFDNAKIAIRFILKEMILGIDEGVENPRDFDTLVGMAKVVDRTGRLSEDAIRKTWDFFLLMKSFELRELLT